MTSIQVITHAGRPAAIVTGELALVADHVLDEHEAHVKAMCLYAMEIVAGTRPGPYSDELAEQYADHALARWSSARHRRASHGPHRAG